MTVEHTQRQLLQVLVRHLAVDDVEAMVDDAGATPRDLRQASSSADPTRCPSWTSQASRVWLRAGIGAALVVEPSF